MTRIITVILVCSFLFFSNITRAEESTERLKDISKAVRAQLLRMKQKEVSVKPKVTQELEEENAKPSSPPKTTTTDIQKKIEKVVEKKTKEAEVTPSELSLQASSKQLEKKAEIAKEDNKVAKKTAKLETKEPPQTNLQKNDLLRQQIQNIVNTSSK